MKVARPPPIETSAASGPSEPPAQMLVMEISAIAGASSYPSWPSRCAASTTPGRLAIGSPQRCSQTVKWLIVYVMLSRPGSLATLKSVGLTSKVRDIIEQGPPAELVATFHKLFDAKIKETKALAARAAQDYNLLPGLT